MPKLARNVPSFTSGKAYDGFGYGIIMMAAVYLPQRWLRIIVKKYLLHIFLRARVCWSLLCLCCQFMIFKRCLKWNSEFLPLSLALIKALNCIKDLFEDIAHSHKGGNQ
jgi:hypothetical protein